MFALERCGGVGLGIPWSPTFVPDFFLSFWKVFFEGIKQLGMAVVPGEMSRSIEKRRLRKALPEEPRLGVGGGAFLQPQKKARERRGWKLGSAAPSSSRDERGESGHSSATSAEP